MMRLPIYQSPPIAPIEVAAPQDLDRSCARCSLGAKARNVCMSAEGEPGGLLVIGEAPSRGDDAVGRPFLGDVGRFLRPLIAAHWKGPVAFDNAIRCPPGRDGLTEASIDACRGYLAGTLREVKPTRVLVIGGWAAYAMFDRSIPMLSTRRGYAHLYSPDIVGAHPVPVFYAMHPVAALRNRFLRRWFEDDLSWALTTPAPPPIPVDAELRIVETEFDALAAEAELRSSRLVTFDIESAGRMFEPSFRVLCVSLCSAGSDSPWAWDRDALLDPARFAPLARVLADPRTPKCGTAVKFDQLGMRFAGAPVQGVSVDVRLLRKLLDPEADAHLDKMAELVGMGGHKAEAKRAKLEAVKRVRAGIGAEMRVSRYESGALLSNGRRAPKPGASVLAALAEWRALQERDPVLAAYIRRDDVESESFAHALIDRDVLLRYNARDVLSTSRLADELAGQIAGVPELQRTFSRLVMPAARALEHVERWGVAADREALEVFDLYLARKQAEIRKRLDAYGHDFNPDSPAQIADLLYKKLGLTPTVFSEKTNAPSTDKVAREALKGQHPIIDDLDDWRSTAKMRSQYASGMLPHILPDGRVHTHILLDGARSGRPSSQNPNLQNIPRAKDSPEGKMARDIFVAAPGRLLYEVDYSQIELRVAAALSQDPEMIAIFAAGVDYHLRTAQMVSKLAWGIPPEAVEDRHRSEAKQINFGLLYGMGDGELARRMRSTKANAARVREAILGKFQKLDRWIRQRLAESRRTGEAWTWWDGAPARRRPLWRIADQDDAKRLVDEHSSWNTPIQGSASELLTASLTELVGWIIDDGLEDVLKLELPIHDALLFEVREDYLPELHGTAREVMCSWNLNGVPIEVDAKVGRSWGSLRPYPAKT